MKVITPDSPLTDLKGVGEKSAEPFQSMGIGTVGDLVSFYPRDYDGFEAPVRVDRLVPDRVQAVKLTILGNASTVHAGRYRITNFRAADETGTLRLTYYNMPYLARTIRAGSIHIFRGMVRSHKNGSLQLEQAAIYAPEEYGKLEGTLQPRYHLTKGLKNTQVIRVTKKALEALGLSVCDPAGDFVSEEQEQGGAEHTGKRAGAPAGVSGSLPADYIPAADRAELGLMEALEALRRIHFPRSAEEMVRARNRIVFDEFFAFAAGIRGEGAKARRMENVRPMLPVAETGRMIEQLPYRLTDSQKKAWREIEADLSGPYVMNRLLQGDVGSGKTILAFLALVMCAANGRQGAIMAPTEVLAQQHMRDFADMAARYHLPVHPVLLTGNVTGKARKEALASIADGSANVIIGTHALIQENVIYRDLSLVITDEQHRFGVRQREIFAGKGNDRAYAAARPSDTEDGDGASKGPVGKASAPVHILVMSATPIPRTLSIILYGDLQVSRLTELPANRLPIKNLAAPSSDRGKMYRFILKQISAGRQAYVICPAVEESEAEGFQELENVTDYTENLRRSLPAAVRIESLNGRMKPAEKNRIMTAFAAHDIDILVSTTVVEVGINVPNATCMLIENAERFGLSQLHQLRGRVGRGEHQSYCMFLYSDKLKEKPERLAILEHTNSGFDIAEQDLKLRGPGDLFGTRQSGAFGFRLADIYEDADLLVKASAYADRRLAEDPALLSHSARLRGVNYRSI